MTATTPPAAAPTADDIVREAATLAANQRFVEALALLVPLAGNGAAPEDANRIDVLNLAAACAASVGQPDAAQSLWVRCIQARPAFTEPYLGLGALLAARGQLAEAQAIYAHLARLSPERAEVHSQHGAVLHRLGRLDEAEAACRRALAREPGHVEALCNLGTVLHDAKRSEEAEAAWRAALAVQPHHARTHNGLGNLLRESGRLVEAELAYSEAVRAQPRYPEALNNLGALQRALGRSTEAELACRLALAVQPDYLEAHNNLGCVLSDLGRLVEAEAAYRQALALRPDYADAHYNLGCVLHARGHLADSEAAFRTALQLAPTRIEALNNLGCVLLDQLRLPEALAAFRAALAVRPDLAEAYYSIGSIMRELGNLDEAEACYRRALELRPGYGDAQFRLATLLLTMGRFEEGWARYECRYEMPGFVHHATQALLKCPKWQGEPLEGRRLLVWQEDGLGDMLQFGRFLALLKAQGAARIVLACGAPLVPLFAGVEGADAVLTHFEAAAEAQNFDAWISAISAPLHLGTTLDTIPPPVRFAPDAARLARWRDRLADLGAGPRVGLVWKGNPRHKNDLHRSLPSLRTLAPLWRVPGARFVSLQKGAGEEEALDAIAGLPPLPIVPLGPELDDFADTAAVVSQLDLVICVDTSTAHLAASLGKPCWVLLPAYDVDWRWLHGRDDSPWYPGTVRLFRRRLDEAWPEVVERVRQACETHFAA
ncbi:tetratricopeptide repeat protein [Paraburkholderia ferrariae]|uniref:tetratricopeptide repeat protein n=1 Tax=Paraburkholderia ferrariae TaxID=386056 RepID=UPI00048810CC|nr:tetratricopeptide repeat protein [Paraburkholderia ferrariae]